MKASYTARCSRPLAVRPYTRVREHSHHRNTDGGYSTEAIAVTAFLVALALAALAILGPKVIDKIQGVSL